MPVKCWKIRIESPELIIQTTDVKWAALKKEEFEEDLRQTYDEIFKRHYGGSKYDLKLERIPCSQLSKTRHFIKHRKPKKV